MRFDRHDFGDGRKWLCARTLEPVHLFMREMPGEIQSKGPSAGDGAAVPLHALRW